LNGTPFGTWAFLGTTTTTVGQIPFTVHKSGYVEIDLLSVELRDADMANEDVNGDGEIAYIDPYIFVFKDDGSLVAENDDSSGTQGVGDGSISGRDSFWAGYLEAGDYVLSVGDYELSQNDAATEINYNSFGPFGGGDSVVTDHGDYQVTFTGDITLPSEVVPPKGPRTIEAVIDVHPETLNVKSKGKFVHCVIRMPDDCDVQDIATDSVALTKINESTLKACLHTTGPSEVGYYDGEPGVRLLRVKFDRKTLIDFMGTAEGKVSLSISGTMEDASTIFEGTDVIRVINGK
jgi:hypothetical protein